MRDILFPPCVKGENIRLWEEWYRETVNKGKFI